MKKRASEIGTHRILTSDAVMEQKKREREEKERKEKEKEENKRKREAKKEEMKAKKAKKEEEKKLASGRKKSDKLNQGFCIMCLMGGVGQEMLGCVMCKKLMHMYCVHAAHQSTMHAAIDAQVPFTCHFGTFVY